MKTDMMTENKTPTSLLCSGGAVFAGANSNCKLSYNRLFLKNCQVTFVARFRYGQGEYSLPAYLYVAKDGCEGIADVPMNLGNFSSLTDPYSLSLSMGGERAKFYECMGWVSFCSMRHPGISHSAQPLLFNCIIELV